MHRLNTSSSDTRSDEIVGNVFQDSEFYKVYSSHELF